ncbi:hypothetical protein B0H21DRAFT_104576 [Amylocystis lapponica]|nr:hypothetical protein B0H21DRAFT_104576 [Amylocystis lapponica]
MTASGASALFSPAGCPRIVHGSSRFSDDSHIASNIRRAHEKSAGLHSGNRVCNLDYLCEHAKQLQRRPTSCQRRVGCHSFFRRLASPNWREEPTGSLWMLQYFPTCTISKTSKMIMHLAGIGSLSLRIRVSMCSALLAMRRAWTVGDSYKVSALPVPSRYSLL